MTQDSEAAARGSALPALTVGSLFSGIGGLDLGLERAGMRVLWQVENDSYARAVLARRFPEATLHADVRRVGAGSLAPVDLICGGFPCQDISNAGKRVGIEGERSGLWGEFARIIRELRPRYVLVENVPALLGRGLERVLGDLAACGYDAEWDCLPASAFGAPHQRDRIFLVANASIEDGRIQPERQSGGGCAPIAGDDGAEGLVAHAAILGGFARRRLQRPQVGEGAWDVDQWVTEPDVGRVADGVPARLDRLRCLGNAVVPQVAEYLGRCLMKAASKASPPSGGPK